jgi:hypothetical protein
MSEGGVGSEVILIPYCKHVFITEVLYATLLKFYTFYI